MANFSRTESPWYALQVRCGWEGMIAKILTNKGYCVFLPTFESIQQWSNRLKKVRSALFPGYIFCQFRLSERVVPVVTTRGVQRIVGCGSNPSPVSESELSAVRSICNCGLPHGPYPFHDSAPTVRIASGPLAGVVGSLVTANGHDSLVITISLLRQSVSVKIPEEQDAAILAGQCGLNIGELEATQIEV